MFFLIRCTFWLSIVFYSMPWPQELPASQAMHQSQAMGQSQVQSQIAGQAAGQNQFLRAVVAGMAGDLAAGAGSMVKAKLEETCTKAPAECRASAVKLLQMVANEAGSEPVPPKRPVRLSESETGHSAVLHKGAIQRD